MYDWLSDALDNSATLITANRRLARVLADEYAAQQLATGKKAWQSPRIFAWQDWLGAALAAGSEQSDLPTRINTQQSQLLWERCLQKEIGDAESSLSNLVRLARDTRQKLSDWQVHISEVAQAAQNDDQRLYASVAGRYESLLEHENWVDDAALGGLVLESIKSGRIRPAARHTFIGFKRERPVVCSIRAALIEAGVEVHSAPAVVLGRNCELQAFVNSDAELRAAGAWARQQYETNPDAHIGIIANGLEKNSAQIAGRVREGVAPGWQYGHATLFDAVNVSYGQRLSAYPAVSSALLLLRWLVDDLSSSDVGLLLRSPQLGLADLSARSRLELRLRQLPDRRWSPSMLTAEFRNRDGTDDDGDDARDWLERLAAFSKRRRELPKSATPSEWAVFVDELLKGFNWPGQGALDSPEFQLVNRWRELLNEFARLGLVSARLGARMMVSRLDLIAGETVFQPESTNAAVQLMGPLDASGASFDAIWISGMTASNWPAAGSRSLLVSRRLQEKYGMPDCTPANTLQFAEQLLEALAQSSETVVCSYAITEDDAEQTASVLLESFDVTITEAYQDPGWHAATLASSAELLDHDDSVPAVTAEELIAGGAGTIQRQIREPIAAFVHGRMRARVIYPQAVGIPAPMRGNMIHDALYKLYMDLPSSESIAAWQGDELTTRIDDAVNFAFGRHEKNTDAVLQQLLLLERGRISDLLREFVAIDAARGNFSIASVEGKFEFVAGNIRMPLRFDRIDGCDDGSIAILDYKTGSKKQLINRSNEAQEIQLFVYACATDAPVSALALVNVDSREIAFNGAGRGYTDIDAWPELLQQIKAQIAFACEDLSNGDVRVNIEQGISAARPLNLLSRYTELRRELG